MNVNYVCTAKEAGEIDSLSIQDYHIPELVLMEKAAMSVAACVMANADRFTDRIVAVCGTGNNAGDAVATCRLLYEEGFDVTILCIGDRKHHSDSMERQLKIVSELGVPCYYAEEITEPSLREYTIIIDGIFGIGLNRQITGDYVRWIDHINQADAMVISIDIPSGIDASTGAVLGCAVTADVTITFGVNKRGLVLYPGVLFSGQVIVADIGFPKKAVSQVNIRAFTLDHEQAVSWLPARKGRSNKGTYGKVLVIAGSPGMSGAALFAASAAYKMGCGLVKVITSKDNRDIIATKLPEAIISAWEPGGFQEKEIKESLAWADAIIIGPGLGMTLEANQLLDSVLNVGKSEGKPVIIDADGLNLLSQKKDIFQEISLHDQRMRKICLPQNIILTPHLKELSRLVSLPVNWISQHLAEISEVLTDSCTVVMKDARTLVTNGDKLYINTTGNNALATGGAGDVLAGMIGGLMAQKMTPFAASCVAVCLHGITADEYVKEYNPYTMVASDILALLPQVLSGYNEIETGKKA